MPLRKLLRNRKAREQKKASKLQRIETETLPIFPLEGAAYKPSRPDGEYNVIFMSKPLGIGLIPSSQLYGTWEVSASHTRKELLNDYDISDGDVVIAMNFSREMAQLPSDQFTRYLQQLRCPIVMTLRKPKVYGSADSRSLATAMYPETGASQPHDIVNKTFKVRVAAKQWKRSLEHDLCYLKSTVRSVVPPSLKMDVNGDFEYVFTTVPISMIFANTTRSYGSVEVYNPKAYYPDIQINDVVLAVNGCPSILSMNVDEFKEYIQRLPAPIHVRFRRPIQYIKHLEAKHIAKNKSKKISYGSSMARAMFPDSKEYKSMRSVHAIQSYTMEDIQHAGEYCKSAHLSKADMKRIAKDQQQWESLRNFAAKLKEKKQFKPLEHRQRGRLERMTSSLSQVLTERHAAFIMEYLPPTLRINELVQIYDSRQDGWNFLTFYNRTKDKGPAILVVTDTHHNVFGAFCSSSLKHSDHVYGNGRSFVFTLSPHMKAYVWGGQDQTFIYGQRDALYIGGGKKGTALSLQLDERRGFTQPCDTFDSPALAEPSQFECLYFEVWAFGGLQI